jgi:hypothetical protein
VTLVNQFDEIIRTATFKVAGDVGLCRGLYNRKFSQYQLDKALEFYAAGYGSNYIANALGCTKRTILLKLRAAGVDTSRKLHYRQRRNDFRSLKGRKNPRWAGRNNPRWKGGVSQPTQKICPVCFGTFVGFGKTCSQECGHDEQRVAITGCNNGMRKLYPPRYVTCRNPKCLKSFRVFGGGIRLYCSVVCWATVSRQSPYQLWIAAQLEQQGFQVELEKSFDWLRSPISNRKLRLDVFLPDESIAIEVDGRHHYDVTARDFIITQVRDQAKNQLLDQHGIPLIRIRSRVTPENLLWLVNAKQSIVI